MADYTASYRKEKLLTRKNQLEARIAELDRKQKAQSRKDDTREKVLVGAGFLADAGTDTDKKSIIRAVLDRAIVAPRDREFLRQRGWLQ